MTKKLKIAMFFASDAKQAGGVQEHVYYLAKELENIGHHVDVFGTEKNLLPYKNYHPIATSLNLPLPSGNWGNLTVENDAGKNILQYLANNKYDLIHVHEPQIPFINWEVMKLTNLPKVTTYHATWDLDSPINVLNSFIPLLKDSFLKQVKGSIFVSKRTKKCWEEVFSQRAVKRIIANGIDLNLFKYKKNNNQKLNILFLARIVPKKGLQFLIRAFEKIIKNNKNITLSVVGDGWDKKNIMNYVKRKKLGRYVKFYGYVDKEKKPEYFQKADIFCAPYINEGFGITLLEAMASGVPIVGFRNDAFDEVLKDYPNRELIVTKKNVDSIYVALTKLINDEKMRSNIRQWELREVKKYSWKKIASEIEAFYFKILKIS